MSEKKIPVFPILLVNFIAILGFSIVLPFLIFLVTRFGGNAIVYGILGSVYPAFQLVGAPILGKWSDVYGRKKILMFSMIGAIVGWMIFLAAFFLPDKILIDTDIMFMGQIIITLPILFLFFARAAEGLTGGNISVANAYLADITDEKDRSKNFGKISMSSNLGFIVGPALSGLLGSTVYGEMIPVIAALIISFTAIFVIHFFLPESSPQSFKEATGNPAVNKLLGCENKESFEIDCKTNQNVKISLRGILNLKSIPYYLLMNFMIFLGFNFFYTAFPVHVVQKLGWTISEMGIYFSVLSLFMVIVQGPVLSFASQRFTDNALISFGSIILGSSFLFLLSENILILYLAAVLFSLGNGLMWPSFLSVLSKAAGKKYQGSVQGFASSAGSLASIIGLIAGGILYTSIGESTFIIPAGIIFLVFLLSFRLKSLLIQE